VLALRKIAFLHNGGDHNGEVYFVTSAQYGGRYISDIRYASACRFVCMPSKMLRIKLQPLPIKALAAFFSVRNVVHILEVLRLLLGNEEVWAIF